LHPRGESAFNQIRVRIVEICEENSIFAVG